MITMEHVSKSYKVAKRNAGFQEACKALFHRKYETIHALRDISFTISDGEMAGYIGPNGAGKSSTIKILSGILTPDGGKVLVDGRIPHKNRIAHVREIYFISDSNYHTNLEELTELPLLAVLFLAPCYLIWRLGCGIISPVDCEV